MVDDGKRKRTAAHGHGFRRRELAVADGGKLVLDTDGSITQFDAQGAPVAAWATSDPEWPSHAIRFGVSPRPSTATPPDSREKESRLPGM